jgi:hypothetical protein
MIKSQEIRDINILKINALEMQFLHILSDTIN